MVFVGSGALKAPHFHSKFMDFLVFWGSGSAKSWSVGASVENCFCISRINSPNWHQRFRIWQSRASWSCIQMPLAMLKASSRGHPDLSTVDVRHRHIIFPCLQDGQNLLPVVVIMDFSILRLNLRPSSLLSAPLLNYFLRQWSSLWLGNHCNRKLVRSNRERDEKKLARSNREREGQRASQRWWQRAASRCRCMPLALYVSLLK